MSGMYAGTLKFDTKIDETGYEQGIKGIESNAKGATDNVNGLTSAFGALAASAAATFVVSQVKEIGSAAIEAASDLNEVRNVVDVTFGEGAGAVEEFAKSAMENFGISRQAALEFSSTIGAMTKAMGASEEDVLEMSTSLAGLSGDLASFRNLKPEEAFEKLKAGITGESEPLKSLGIVMNETNLKAFAMSQGIKTSYSEMTEAEKVSLRYQYIMQATADAQGDAAATSDSYAGQIRQLEGNMTDLYAAIGENLLPAAEAVLGVINDAIKAVSGLIQASNEGDTRAQIIVGILEGLTIAITAFVVVMGVLTVATTAWSVVSGAAAVATSAFTTALAVLTSPITAVIAAIVAVVAAVWILVENWDVVKKAAIAAWEAIKEKFGEFKDWFVKTIVEPVKNGVNTALGFAEKFANGFISAVNKVIQAINSIDFTVPDWIPKIGGKNVKFSLNEIKEVKLPRLASGAVIPPNREFMAVLGDQKSGTNIEAPLDTIKQAVAEVVGRTGGGNQTIVMQIDGKEFARVIAPYSNSETSRGGIRLSSVVVG